MNPSMKDKIAILLIIIIFLFGIRDFVGIIRLVSAADTNPVTSELMKKADESYLVSPATCRF